MAGSLCDCMLGRGLPNIVSQSPRRTGHLNRHWAVRNLPSHSQSLNNRMPEHLSHRRQFPAARRAVDTDIHSGKGHSIAIAKLIRAHFETHPEGSLRFWECPSKAERFINAEVHKEVTRTRYPTEERMQTSYDMLRQTNSKKCLEEWVTNFTKGDIRGRGFLTTRMNKRDESRPTYARGETWLSLFGSITLCARAVRTTLVHAPIGKCRARFHP